MGKFLLLLRSEYRNGPRYRFYVYPDAIVTRKGSKKELYEKRSTQFSAKDSTVREVIKATEKYFMDKCELIKKSESVSVTTSLNSPSAPPIFTNDSLRYMGKMESLKHKLTEKEEVVRKITGELEQTRKKLKSANISKAMTSKRRASRARTRTIVHKD